MVGLLARSDAEPGVTSTSTGPRVLSSAMSGVVRTASPRKLVWMTSDSTFPGPSFDLKDRQEGLLRDLHRAHLLHPLLSLLLLLEELPLAGDVAAVALGEHVLAQRLHGSARDHLGADRRLNHHLEELTRNQLLELVGHLAAPLVRLVPVDDHRERVDGVAVDQHVELHEVALAILKHLVVEPRVAATDGLELVVEVEDDLGERKLPVELHAARVHVAHVLVYAAPFCAERHDGADVLGRRDDARLHER